MCHVNTAGSFSITNSKTTARSGSHFEHFHLLL
jgi:hypothetical protein